MNGKFAHGNGSGGSHPLGFTALLALILVTGCSPHGFGPRPSDGAGTLAGVSARTQHCMNATCPIEVDVDAYCNVNVADFVVKLGGRPPLTRTLRFRITNPDYEFRSSPRAVVGKDTSFFDDLALDGPLIANVKATIANAGRGHEYGLNVVRKSSGVPCPQFDPWIVE